MKITEEEGVWACLALLLAFGVFLLAACLGWEGEGKGVGEVEEDNRRRRRVKEDNETRR